MLEVLRARLSQGRRTIRYPKAAPVLPDRMRGRPRIDAARCPPGCASCQQACPTGACSVERSAPGAGPRIDMGQCLFCGDCARACGERALELTPEHRLAARSRDELVVDSRAPIAALLDRAVRSSFGRSLKLRQVSAGGCNACEADVNVLNTVVFDLSRFGIQFVASPRHADGLLVTGPVSANMRLALEKTWAAVPSPRIVIAVGACAIASGPFAGHPEVCGGVASVIPVDLFVPGCPPHPMTILDALLRYLGHAPEPGA